MYPFHAGRPICRNFVPQRALALAICLWAAALDWGATADSRDYEDGIQDLAGQISDMLVQLDRDRRAPLDVYVLPGRSFDGVACEPFSSQLRDRFNAVMADRRSRMNLRHLNFSQSQGDNDEGAITLEWSRESAGADGTVRIESKLAEYASRGTRQIAQVSIRITDIPDSERVCLTYDDGVRAECNYNPDSRLDRAVRLRSGPVRGGRAGAIAPGQPFDVLAAYDEGASLLLSYALGDPAETSRIEEGKAFSRASVDTLREWEESGICEFVSYGDFEIAVPDPLDLGPWPPTPGTPIQDCNGCPKLVVLPDGPDGRTLLMAETEITAAQWRSCVEGGGCDRLGRPEPESPDHPAAVSYREAERYAEWLAGETGKPYRLPTEAEWEFAAFAGGSSRYPWGDVMPERKVACRTCGGPQPAGPARVATAEARDNRYRLYDMNGNVWEWVSCTAGGPAPCPDGLRVLKGGSFADDALALTNTSRHAAPDTETHPAIGFRVVRDGENR
ncbi:MAG: formylglycine-generating enzyme family protein [Paracoccaceae bacterium]